MPKAPVSDRSAKTCFARPCATALLFALLSPSLLAETDSERERIAAVTQPTKDFSRPEAYERRPGGAATTFKIPNRSAFSHHSANMPPERQLGFHVGDGIFKKLWVSSPSSTESSDGLGPLFNARSCQRCHRKDGRGRPPPAGERPESMLLHLSVPPRNDQEQAALKEYRLASIPEPTYGGQLQNYSVQAVPAEGEMTVAYREIPVSLADGEAVSLRAPTYGVKHLRYGPLHPGTMMSPRVAPPVIGMGLLEAIPEADILAGADPDDRDSDGISGRASRAWSDEHGRVMLGRFGWKAGQPTVAQQTAAAFRGDIGISTPLYPAPHGDCTPKQEGCRSAHHGTSESEPAEAGQKLFGFLTFYSRNLAVPARRNIDDAQVLEGKRLFYEADCTGCHRPKFVTRRDSIGDEQSFQLIWPYTDLLLHDMGEGLSLIHI